MTVDSLSSARRPSLPEGVVTFLFTDIEGSTKLLARLGDDYADVLSTHHKLMRASIAAHHGCEVDTEGDAFFVAFSSPLQAVAAAADAQQSLHSYPWPHGEPVRVRMGLHTGEPLVVEGNYVGMDVHRAARICSAAHGGQVVVSARLRDLVGDRTADGVSFADLGDHYLKDLRDPERLLQLDVEGLPTSFPPLRSQRAPCNIPSYASNLIGRDRERKELRTLLQRAEVRLVTVTGPGGTGKTRLAAATALDMLEEFPHGVYFVDLSSVREGDQVLPEIARVLRVPADSADDAGEAVAAHIGDRAIQLVLDNFEQVLHGALAVAHLLEACPRLHIVATSRLRLALAGEHEYPLAPLGLPAGPSVKDVSESEAVLLFVARANRVRPGLEVTDANAAAIGRICVLLDGLPLAIELAAARTKLFPPQALVGKLGNRLQLLAGGSKDAPERHRALRSTIDWSYDLLAPQERQFFCDFAVFTGGAAFESVEAVIAPDGDVLDLMTTLVDHSLVRQQEDADGRPRFTMLQTLRDYASEHLRERPAHFAEMRQRHALHYLDLVEQATRPSGPDASDRQGLAAEVDNIRAALGFWLGGDAENPDAGVRGLRLASLMGQYWYQHGLVVEGTGWLERALAAAPDPPEDDKARALRMLGVMLEQRREFDRATELFEEARALYRQTGDRLGEGQCLNSLGITARSAGQAEAAEEYLLEAAAIRREVDDTPGLTKTLNNLGILYTDRGEWQMAQAVFLDTLARDREAGDDWGAACTSLNLAVAYLLGHDVNGAEPLLRAALADFLELDDMDGLIESLEALVGLAVERSQWVAAARLSGAADSGRDVAGLPGSPADRVHLERWLATCKENLDPAAFGAASREGAMMTPAQAATYALGEVVNASPATER